MADIPFDPDPYYAAGRPELQATAGGLGSFSYADTTVYGNRQDRTGYINSMRFAWVGGVYLPVYSAPSSSGSLIVPGTGGGAKLPGKRYYGSRAVGASPNGAVLIRLFKVS